MSAKGKIMTTEVVKKQGNRPSKYKQSILADLFEMLARGKTIKRMLQGA